MFFIDWAASSGMCQQLGRAAQPSSQNRQLNTHYLQKEKEQLQMEIPQIRCAEICYTMYTRANIQNTHPRLQMVLQQLKTHSVHMRRWYRCVVAYWHGAIDICRSSLRNKKKLCQWHPWLALLPQTWWLYYAASNWLGFCCYWPCPAQIIKRIKQHSDSDSQVAKFR